MNHHRAYAKEEEDKKAEVEDKDDQWAGAKEDQDEPVDAEGHTYLADGADEQKRNFIKLS